MNAYLIEQFLISFKFLIEILLGKIHPVVTEKHDVEYGDESKCNHKWIVRTNKILRPGSKR